MYWAGAHKAATRLFATTVSKNTGAESEIAARARLATIQGDLLEAANHQYERIKRYQSSFAMRDLMGLLAIISGGEEALQLAHSLTPFMTKPPVWHGNLFAHRVMDRIIRNRQNGWTPSCLKRVIQLCLATGNSNKR